MSKLILIEEKSGQREIALMEDNRLLSFCREEGGHVEAEQIYLGAADRMVRGVEAAFVRLGGGQTGFLPFSECREKPRSGEKMLVQVKKSPAGDKAPYLTRDISLAGRYAVYTPLSSGCAVSKRIADGALRERLWETARRLRPPEGGLVMRLESAGAPEADIAAEIAALRAKWAALQARAAGMAAPGLVEGRMDALSRLMRDEHGAIEKILTDSPEALTDVPLPAEACDHPFALFGVRAKLEKSLQRKVWLDCGGYLVVDRTEAMTVIDVNSGKFVGGKSGAESTFLQLNREAAKEIARLLRLRNIGGIVIVDFVDMQAEESRAAVTEEMERALSGDPVKTVVHGFTALGLMELTRKKTEESQ